MPLIITSPCCGKRLEVKLTAEGLIDFLAQLKPSTENLTIEELLWLLKVGLNLATLMK